MRHDPGFHPRMYSAARALVLPAARHLFGAEYAGLQNVPESGGLILCCNHRSVYDPFLLAAPLRRPVRFMAKSEFFTDHGRLLRRLLFSFGAFPVRRGTGDLSSLRAASEILGSGGAVGIFPQGAVTADGVPFQAKPGAALLAVHSGAPILPAAILCRGPLKPFRGAEIRFGRPIRIGGEARGEYRSSAVRRVTALIEENISALLEGKE